MPAASLAIRKVSLSFSLKGDTLFIAALETKMGTRTAWESALHMTRPLAIVILRISLLVWTSFD